jgi:hypothetical protein
MLTFSKTVTYHRILTNSILYLCVLELCEEAGQLKTMKLTNMLDLLLYQTFRFSSPIGQFIEVSSPIGQLIINIFGCR